MSQAVYEKIKPKPIFQIIIEQIRDQITSGSLKPGDLLPAERQLAEMMGVNRHSLREALKVLEFLGVVQSRTGIGTIVNNLGQDILCDRVAQAANFSPRFFLFELMELRQAIEPHAAALASERATMEDLAVLEKTVVDLRADFESGEFDTDADERLHLALAQATHNDTFVRLTEPMMAMLTDYRQHSLRIQGRRKETLIEHERIFKAVQERRPEKAKEAMADHLRNVEEMLRKVEKALTENE